MSKKICGAKGAANDTIQRIRVACWISKATSAHAYAHVHVPWHPHTHARAYTHTHAHTHTQRQTCNSDCFSTATTIRERASVLRYTYIACVVSCIRHSARCYQLQDRAHPQTDFQFLLLAVRIGWRKNYKIRFQPHLN